VDQALGIVAPDLFDGAFADRRVLLTGHTGFKGAWLAVWLQALGARVTGYALAPPTQPNTFEAAAVASGLAEDYRADLCDRDALLRALRSSQAEVILHLAARTVVRDGYLNPREMVAANVMGTVTLLDAIRERGQPCAVVVVSSDKCYANDELGRPFEETDRLGGEDVYSASKAAVEIVTHAYRTSFFPPAQIERHGVAVATARAGNVIGGGDWTPDGLVADVMRALYAGSPVSLRYPRAVRPWQHVLEPLSGYLTLARRLLGADAASCCGAWNFGPSDHDAVAVSQLVELLLREWGEGSWRDDSRPEDPPEAQVLRLSSRKAARLLGWRARWRIDEAVARTVRWYQRFRADPGSARAACLEDICAYSTGEA
jgi:CDP-glucose 4,6-dehydratase